MMKKHSKKLNKIFKAITVTLVIVLNLNVINCVQSFAEAGTDYNSPFLRTLTYAENGRTDKIRSFIHLGDGNIGLLDGYTTQVKHENTEYFWENVTEYISSDETRVQQIYQSFINRTVDNTFKDYTNGIYEFDIEVTFRGNQPVTSYRNINQGIRLVFTNNENGTFLYTDWAEPKDFQAINNYCNRYIYRFSLTERMKYQIAEGYSYAGFEVVYTSNSAKYIELATFGTSIKSNSKYIAPNTIEYDEYLQNRTIDSLTRGYESNQADLNQRVIDNKLNELEQNEDILLANAEEQKNAYYDLFSQLDDFGGITVASEWLQQMYNQFSFLNATITLMLAIGVVGLILGLLSNRKG